MKSGKEKIIDLISESDNIPYDEAKSMVNETIDMMMKAIESGNIAEVDDILMCELGLEPDYIFDLIGY